MPPNGITGRELALELRNRLYAIHNTLQITQADGSRILFIRDPKNPSLCASNNPANGHLANRRGPRGDEYLWTWRNGRT